MLDYEAIRQYCRAKAQEHARQMYPDNLPAQAAQRAEEERKQFEELFRASTMPKDPYD